MSHKQLDVILVDLGLTEHDEVGFVAREVLEVVDIPGETFEIPSHNTKRDKLISFNIYC